ncbi:MAG: 23S rRNA (pseudouridine(1915)-N(3))-methyltransferase RlmH [Hyphomicrobiaceae bacterium]
MRIVIACVGRLKDGPERDLYERYAGRLDATGRAVALGPLTLAEVPEGRAADKTTRLADEGQRLLAACGEASVRIVLDERGKSLSSTAFAQFLARHRDDGVQRLALLIGGADGHGAEVLAGATLKLSLGAMTLPHGLARIVLAEQLYRAATILTGHPYHRE